MTPTQVQRDSPIQSHSPKQLDENYSALAQAITRVGAGKTELFLATLSLALLAEHPNPEQCLAMIAQAEKLAHL
jgi:superfamily II DNA/RNA helicase